MILAVSVFEEKSRLRALLDHFSAIDDPRDVRRVAHPLPEVLLLVVFATLADCDGFGAIAAWGKAHLPFLRHYLRFDHGVPGGRWINSLMNRIDPALFAAAFIAWVRETWPDRPRLVAIDGKTSRRSRDRAAQKAPLPLVSAFATTSRLVLGQEAVEVKTNELAAIPALIGRLAEKGGLKDATVSIDAIATNAIIAQAIKDSDADCLLAVKANQPTLRAETESLFAAADPKSRDGFIDHDGGHDRIEQRTVSVIRSVKAKQSIKLRRNVAGWEPNSLADLLGVTRVNLDPEPWRRRAEKRRPPRHEYAPRILTFALAEPALRSQSEASLALFEPAEAMRKARPLSKRPHPFLAEGGDHGLRATSGTKTTPRQKNESRVEAIRADPLQSAGFNLGWGCGERATVTIFEIIKVRTELWCRTKPERIKFRTV